MSSGGSTRVEAAVVRRIFELYAAGVPLRAIARILVRRRKLPNQPIVRSTIQRREVHGRDLV
jgi:hypothetical protein